MHEQVKRWVQQHLPVEYGFVVEYGAQDMNGGIRGLLDDGCWYTGVDIAAGAGVDVVADAATWRTDQPVDLIICCEVFEHTSHWADIIANAYQQLEPGGTFIATAAGPGRLPHSGLAATAIQPGEWYANIGPAELALALIDAGFEGASMIVNQHGRDIRCAAVKGAPKT